MIICKEIDSTQPLAPSQIEMLHNLETKPVFLDEDCPELTVEQLAQFVKHSDSEQVDQFQFEEYYKRIKELKN